VKDYLQLYTNNYFWRTVQKHEIDFVEEINGQITTYEFKRKSKGKVKIPAVFLNQYNAIGKIIDKENFREFVRKGKWSLISTDCKYSSNY